MQRKAARFGLAVVGVFLAAGVFLDAAAWAAPFPLDPQFQVNVDTAYGHYRPRVATDPAGNFVVVWYVDDLAGGGDPNGSIHARRFDSAGLPLGTEFQVNNYTTGVQYWPGVAVDGTGNFVVVWNSFPYPGPNSRFIQARRFDSDGLPLGTEFQVNSYTTVRQYHPDVAADGTGNFVVVWHSNSSAGSDQSAESIQSRRFDNTGAPLGTEIQVNSYTTADQRSPRVAADQAGNFVVVWQSNGSAGSDSSLYSIQGQRFDNAGAPVGTEFQVNTDTGSSQLVPTVAADPAGNFVIVWANGLASVRGQRFDNTGVPVGTEFQANSYTAAGIRYPSIAAGSAGGFVVVWEGPGSSGTDSSYSSIQGQRFDGAGMPLGTQFQINTYTTLIQRHPGVAVVDMSDFVVVWHDQREQVDSAINFSRSIQGQRFSTMPLCGSAPEADNVCRLADPTGNGKSSLQIFDSIDNGKDRFKWKWTKGVATTLADFKAPTTGDATYRLCIYDGSGGTQPLLEADLPNGDGWREIATTRLKYRSKVGGTLSGITDVAFKAGAAGKARLQVTGKGALFHPPATGGLVSDVVVQMLIDDGITIECFKTAFPGPSGAGAVTSQDSTEFKAKGP